MGLAREKAVLICSLENLSHELLGVEFERVTTKPETKSSIMDVLEGNALNTFYIEINSDWLLNTDNNTVILILLQKFRLVYQLVQIFNLKTKVESLKYIEDKSLVLKWQKEMEDSNTPMVFKHMLIDSLAYAKLVFSEIYGKEFDIPRKIRTLVNERLLTIKNAISSDLNKIKNNRFRMMMLTKYVNED